MDIEKAKVAATLYNRRSMLETSIKDLDTVYRGRGSDSTTTIQVPVSWLPGIIELAKDDLEEVNNKIKIL